LRIVIDKGLKEKSAQALLKVLLVGLRITRLGFWENLAAIVKNFESGE